MNVQHDNNEMPLGVMPDKPLRIEELASQLNIHRTTLLRLVARGEFPAPVKIGKASIWFEADVRNWINRKRQAQAA